MKKLRKFMIFFNAEGGAGGGGEGAPAAPADVADIFQGAPGAPPEPAEPTATPTEPQKPAEPTAQPSAADLARELAREIRGGQQQQQQKQYSPEELDKMFNVWKPEMALVQAIREGDEAAAIQAVSAMRDGLLRQFHTLADFQIKAAVQEMEAKFGPALQGTERLEAERQEKSFFEAHADLVESKDLVRTVFNAMRAEGKTFETPQLASKAVADRARQLLGKQAPTGSGEGQPTPANNPNGSGRPAALTGGSQASAPQNRPSAPDIRTTMKDLFG